MKQVNIYTDGSCNVSKRLGGWGVYFEYTNEKGILETKELSGNRKDTTNNLMELRAVCEAIKASKLGVGLGNYVFNIHMDSKYVMLALYNRDENLAKDFKKVANAEALKWFYNFLDSNGILLLPTKQSKSDLSEITGVLPNGNHIKFIKVLGHSDNLGNIKADELAVTARKLLG